MNCPFMEELSININETSLSLTEKYCYIAELSSENLTNNSKHEALYS